MSLRIQKEGILTTVQGLGQYGMQRFGINPGGAMDRTAVRLINTILGNSEENPVLEMHFPAGEIVFEKGCTFALGGADFSATLNGEPIENWYVTSANRSSVLKFEKKVKGSRCYLAVAGGFSFPPTTPQVSTSRLRTGQKLELLPPNARNVAAGPGQRISNSLIPLYGNFPTVRIVAGGECEMLSDADKQLLTQENFVITNDSNRMGFRLSGRVFERLPVSEMVSSAVTFGTIQLLPNGQLIVLMADHQTSGGYPRIANVISVDFPLLAQTGANDKVAFKMVDVGEAERAAMRLERDIRRLRIGCRFGRYWD